MLQRRLFALTRSAPAAFVATVATGWLAALAAVGQAWCLSVIIDAAFLSGAASSSLIGWLAATASLIVIRGAATALSENAAAAGSRVVRARLRLRLAQALMGQGLTFSTSTQSGEHAQTLTDGVEALDPFFSQYLPQLAQTALIPLTLWLVIAGRDPATALALAVMAPLIPIFMVLIGATTRSLTRRQFGLLGQLGGHFLDLVQGLTTLKLLGRGAAQASVLATYSARYRDATLAVLRLAFLSALALELLTTLSTAVVAVEIGLRLLSASLGFQTALFVLVLTPDFFLPLRMLGQRYHAAAAGLTAAERLFEWIDRPAPAAIVNHPPAGGGLRVDGVTIAYPDGRRALEDVSLSVPPGSVVAVIGANGSGKSTLLRVIAGLQRVDAGQVGFCLHDPARDGTGIWPQGVAYLAQGAHLFAGTLRDNIALSRPNATYVEILAAAEAAGLGAFLKQLPDGLSTAIDEVGRNLSGGQKQRVALARICLQAAPLVVLDEPEQALDALLLARLAGLIRGWHGARTVVVAAHRLGIVEHADWVVLLEHGRVALSGPPAQVLPQCPWLDDAMVPLEAEAQPQHAVVDTLPGAPRESESGARQVLRQLVGLARSEWRAMALALTLTTLTIASSAALMTTSAYLISAAALHPPLTALSLAIVGTRAFGLARGVLRYLERLTTHDVSLRLLASLRVWFYATLEPLWPGQLPATHSADLMTRAVADVDTLQDAYVRLFAPPAAAVIAAIAGAAVLGAIDPLLALVGLIGAVGVSVVLSIWGAKASQQPGLSLVAARAGLQRAIVDGIQGQAELLTCGRAGSWIERVEAAQAEALSAQRRLSTVAAIQSGLALTLTHLTGLGLLARGLDLVAAGGLDAVWLAPLVLGALAAFEAFLPLPHSATAMGTILAAARRVFGVVAPTTTTRVDRGPGPASPLHSEPARLVINGLTFAYPGQPRDALQSIHLVVEPGQRTALVGPSGSGKSTLVSLIAGLWASEPGRIFLNDCDIAEMSSAERHQRISVLEQSPHLFNASIRDNLLLADPTASAERLWNMLDRVGMRTFVQGLPGGLETLIGERGLGLSGGQRQRLALARVLLRPGGLLIADEPTAHLDPDTADDLLAELCARSPSRSLIVISHDRLRFTDFDRVWHMQAGQVQGPWPETSVVVDHDLLVAPEPRPRADHPLHL